MSKAQDAYLKALTNFVKYLNDTVTYHPSVIIQPLFAYDRITGTNEAGEAASVVCFVVKKDFENKRLGLVRTGDILYPASYGLPARRVRGNIFTTSSYRSGLFDTYGMKPLNAK